MTPSTGHDARITSAGRDHFQRSASMFEVGSRVTGVA